MKNLEENDINSFFQSISEPFLNREDVEKGTMMGFPCLRVGGQFFASCDPKSGDLLIKLPASEVTRMVEAGEGSSFSPAGRTFREWVVVSERNESRWNALVNDALLFVSSK